MSSYESIFNSTNWYKALTLSERAETVNGNLEGKQTDTELAMKYVNRWRQQRPFTNEKLFAEKLKLAGFDQSSFTHLLGMPLEDVKNDGKAPEWLQRIQTAYKNFAPSQYVLFSQVPKDQPHLLLLTWIEPLLHQGIKQIRADIQELLVKYKTVPFDAKQVEELIFSQIPKNVLPLISRTLALELNVARMQGHLSGASPEERYQAFIHLLQQPEYALNLLEEYNVLARQIINSIDLWSAFNLEFLENLCRDQKTLESHFASADLGMITQIDAGQGDRHNFGRSVIIITFSSGTKVVYKPRSLSIDNHFQELLLWCNEVGFEPRFRTLTVLDQGTHGWLEFVEAHGCTTNDQMERFYERQGGYLALLYALEAVDFHYENLISSGEHPVLVDLESLFHPHLEALEERGTEINLHASNQMTYSVLRVGLLPQKIWGRDDQRGVDFSGFGAQSGQLTPIKVLNWENSGSDEMRFTRKHMPIPGGNNRPCLNGQDVTPLNYVESIQKGFRKLYDILLHERDTLLAEDGPLWRFNNDDIRVIVRPTMVYGLLLQESYHPDFLRDALTRDCHFDRLWIATETRPYLKRLLPYEYSDFQRGDIPMFTAKPSSRSLWSCSGDEVGNILDDTSLNHVRSHIQRLNQEDLERQSWFISASLTTLAMGTGQAHWPSYHFVPSAKSMSRDQYLAKARAIGDRIQKLAIQPDTDDEPVWLGVTLFDEQNWTLLPLGIDLYNGSPGIALFLAQLGALTQEVKYSAMARQIARAVVQHSHNARSSIKSVGGFNGWGSLIYLFTYLGRLWDDATLIAEAHKIVDLLPPLIAEDAHLDIVNGTAGCLTAVLNLNQVSPSIRLIKVAKQCGDHLLHKSHQEETGIGWFIGGMDVSQPLAGFSHGNAGFASVLLELAALTGESAYDEAAQAAIAYERSIFVPEEGNWPDFRIFDDDHHAVQNEEVQKFMIAWCHGAPGIGLGRVQAMKLGMTDSITCAEIDTAVKTTVQRGFGNNHSLCHGDLGNLDFLIEASKVTQFAYLQDEVPKLAATIVQSITDHGCLTGIPLGVETPGLMSGLAGIGYELLRLAASNQVPSVLTLSIPD